MNQFLLLLLNPGHLIGQHGQIPGRLIRSAVRLLIRKTPIFIGERSGRDTGLTPCRRKLRHNLDNGSSEIEQIILTSMWLVNFIFYTCRMEMSMTKSVECTDIEIFLFQPLLQMLKGARLPELIGGFGREAKPDTKRGIGGTSFFKFREISAQLFADLLPTAPGVKV